jgi:hypothetical protein
MRKRIFVTHSCGQYMTIFFTQNSHISLINTDEALFHQTGSISAHNSRYLSSINPRQTFEVNFHDQKIGVRRAVVEHIINSGRYVLRH